MFIFTLLCGASKGFMKAFKAFIKPFEAPQRSVKTKLSVDFFSLFGIETGTVKIYYWEDLPLYLQSKYNGK